MRLNPRPNAASPKRISSGRRSALIGLTRGRPDSKWIAYVPVGDKLFKNVFVAPVAGGEARQITFVANGGHNTISWSPDGTYILFDTGQRTETAQLARVDLIPRTPRFREDQFRDLFREEQPRPPLRQQQQPATEPQPAPTPAAVPITSPSASPTPGAGVRPAPRPVQIEFDQIRRRLTLLPVGIDVRYHKISPDGKLVLMIASVANQTNLYVYPLDELSRDPLVSRQLTSTAGFKTTGAVFGRRQRGLLPGNGTHQHHPAREPSGAAAQRRGGNGCRFCAREAGGVPAGMDLHSR
jgi:hypothetical protein